ncbi:MAG: hypothetical protein MJE68_17705 [Proteobacteria bacterium]|nr:hypothetical protein [Pseudomonadota bacterium]
MFCQLPPPTPLNKNRWLRWLHYLCWLAGSAASAGKHTLAFVLYVCYPVHYMGLCK